MRTVNGIDVLPWFAPVSETPLPIGARLCDFRSYHTAPEGTWVRLGRKNGIGQRMVKRGDAWYPDGVETNGGLTAYGMEGRPSYVEEAS